MTKQQPAWQARRDELERRDRQQREAVIAEFAAEDPDGTLQAMAAEILRYRARLAEARRRAAAEIGPTAPTDRPTASRVKNPNASPGARTASDTDG